MSVGGTAIQPTAGVSRPATPSISSALFALGTVGSAFSYQITATGIGTPTSYAAAPLPAGLAVNAGTGAITGTPTTAGQTSVTITATGTTGVASATLTIVILAAAEEWQTVLRALPLTSSTFGSPGWVGTSTVLNWPMTSSAGVGEILGTASGRLFLGSNGYAFSSITSAVQYRAFLGGSAGTFQTPAATGQRPGLRYAFPFTLAPFNTSGFSRTMNLELSCSVYTGAASATRQPRSFGLYWSGLVTSAGAFPTTGWEFFTYSGTTLATESITQPCAAGLAYNAVFEMIDDDLRFTIEGQDGSVILTRTWSGGVSEYGTAQPLRPYFTVSHTGSSSGMSIGIGQVTVSARVRR